MLQKHIRLEIGFTKRQDKYNLGRLHCLLVRLYESNSYIVRLGELGLKIVYHLLLVTTGVMNGCDMANKISVKKAYFRWAC